MFPNPDDRKMRTTYENTKYKIPTPVMYKIITKVISVKFYVNIVSSTNGRAVSYYWAVAQ